MQAVQIMSDENYPYRAKWGKLEDENYSSKCYSIKHVR
jgi:hypothetical protein